MKRIRHMLIATCVTALVLGGGCGKKAGPQADIEAAYRAYEKALRASDQAALAKIISGDRKDELAGADAAMKLELINAMRPPEVSVLNVFVTNTAASMEVEGAVQGQKAKGEVLMVQEADGWKVVTENWSITMTMDGMTGLEPEVKPFMPDPAQPPQMHAVLEGHQDQPSKIIFTRDGSLLISASYGDYSIRLWDPETKTQLQELKTDNRVRGLALSRDGRSLIAADAYMNVTVYPLEANALGTPARLIEEAGDEVAISDDGKLLATTAYQKPVRIWDFPNGAPVKTIDGSEGARCLAFSPAGDVLVGAGDNNSYTVWDTKKWKGKKREVSKVQGGASCIAISRDGKLLAIGFSDSSIVIIDLAKGKELQNFFVQDAATTAVAFSPDGKILATGNRSDIHVWDAETIQKYAVLKGHSSDVGALAFSPDGSTLVSGGSDRKLILWRSGPPPAGGAEKPKPAQAAAPAAAAAALAGPVLELPGAKNLVRNSSGNLGLTGWKTDGDASADKDASGNPCFAVRYNGMIWQDARLPPDAKGFVLVVARASAERVEEDGDQTGLPYLYGNWVNSEDPNRFNGYLNAREMTLANAKPGAWGVVYAVYPIPPQTAAVRLFLDLADGGKSQNGSAGRFDDAAVFYAATEAAALGLLDAYRGKAAAMPVKPSVKPKPAKAPSPAPASAVAPKKPVAPAQPAALPLDSYVGRKLEDVFNERGWPKMQMKQGKRVIYIYNDREISSSDGVTVDRDEPGKGM